MGQMEWSILGGIPRQPGYWLISVIGTVISIGVPVPLMMATSTGHLSGVSQVAPAPMALWTWPGMFGNGLQIGTLRLLTQARTRRTRLALLLVTGVWFEGEVGAVPILTYEQPSDSIVIQPSGSGMWASAAHWM